MTSSSWAPSGLLAQRVDELRSGGRAQSRPKLIATAHDEPLPLSASQLRSWFAYRVDGPSPVNNIPFAARLTGPWDIDALIAAVGDVVARHEILRTTYIDVDGVPYQVVGPAAELAVRRADGDGEAWLQRATRRRASALLRTRPGVADPGRRAAGRRQNTCCHWSFTTSRPTTGLPACCSPT